MSEPRRQKAAAREDAAASRRGARAAKAPPSTSEIEVIGSETTIPVNVTGDVGFILAAAPRLAKLSAMVTVSFGLGEGANRALKHAAQNDQTARERGDDWQQAVLGYQDGTLMMAVVRVALLLDSDPKCVSFQTVYHRLKRKEVQDALIERVFGEDESIEELLGRGPQSIIADFLSHYASIDWSIHGRLTHFRNLGIAHLSTEPLGKSITFDELKFMANIVSKLGDELVALCRTSFVSIEPMLSDWSDRGFSILKVKD
jgi:hypothetical protein